MACNHILRIIQPGFAELMMIQNGPKVTGKLKINHSDIGIISIKIL